MALSNIAHNSDVLAQRARAYWMSRLGGDEPSGPIALLGLDIGQVSDYSSLVIAEVESRARDVNGVEKRQNHYIVKLLRRFDLGTSYADVIAECKDIDDTLSETYPLRKFLVDAGGARPIIDVARAHDLRNVLPVQLKFSGRSQIRDGFAYISKIDLAQNLAVLTNPDNVRIHLPKSSPFAKAMMEELRAYQIKLTQSGNMQFGAFDYQSHDDLVSSLGYVCWYGERNTNRGPRVHWIA